MDKPDPHETLADYLEAANMWQLALAEYSQNEMEIKPGVDIWSLAQLYNHWLDASQLYMLGKIKGCLANPERHLDGEVNELGVVLLTTNKFPLADSKVPVKNVDQPRNIGDKNLFLTRIQELNQQMERTSLVLANDPPSGRSGNWFFGFMNAHQWYRLIPIHMQHHFQQKAKLNTFLSKD